MLNQICAYDIRSRYFSWRVNKAKIKRMSYDARELVWAILRDGLNLLALPSGSPVLQNSHQGTIRLGHA